MKGIFNGALEKRRNPKPNREKGPDGKGAHKKGPYSSGLHPGFQAKNRAVRF
jgi:hypothetical protein